MPWKKALTESSNACYYCLVCAINLWYVLMFSLLVELWNENCWAWRGCQKENKRPQETKGLFWHNQDSKRFLEETGMSWLRPLIISDSNIFTQLKARSQQTVVPHSIAVCPVYWSGNLDNTVCYLTGIKLTCYYF